MHNYSVPESNVGNNSDVEKHYSENIFENCKQKIN